MTVQTAVGQPDLTSGAFTSTFNSTTWGLRVRYLPTEDGTPNLDVILCTKVPVSASYPTGWKFQASFGGSYTVLCDSGLSVYLANLKSAINTWLKSFGWGSGGGTPTPTPAPVIPAEIAQLDAALQLLSIDTSAGYPQIK